MRTQVVEQIELFSEAELESLEFVPEELEAIEAERVPDLDSISFEEVAKDLEAYFEGGVEGARLERLPPELWSRILLWRTVNAIRARIRNLENPIQNLENRIRELDNLRREALRVNNAARANQLRMSINVLQNQRNQLIQQLQPQLDPLRQQLNQLLQRIRNSG